MTWSVPRRELDYDGSIAEHVSIFAVEEHRLAFFELAIKCRIRRSWTCRVRIALCEHRFAFDLLYDPRRTSERIGISHVVAMIVRQRKVRDISRRVSDFRKLRQERFGHSERALRRWARRFELRVRNF